MSIAPASDALDLDVHGMTCAACAARIEKKLNRIEGVEASVNYATESAHVVYRADAVTPMQLVDAVRAAGYDAVLPPAPSRQPQVGSSSHAPTTPYDSPVDHRAEAEPAQRGASLRDRLVVCAFLGVPVLAVSMVPAMQMRNWQWLALLLATPVVTWGAWPFHRAAGRNLLHGTATMDTLVSLGVLAAYGASLGALVWGGAGDAGMRMDMSLRAPRAAAGHHLYFEAACAVTLFLLTGRFLEARAKRAAGDALRSLLELGAKEARLLLDDGSERSVAVTELVVGSRFVVRPGEQLATDGRVVEGSSAVDASLVTGESVPVEVGVGAEVIGGAVNAGGRLVVEATRVGADTALARIARLVREAQSGKAPVQRLADRVSAVFVPIVLVLALLTALVWWVRGEHGLAFSAAVAVLVIACPCALGLATPTALLVGTGRAAQLGIIMRGPEVLEHAHRVDTVVLDKTGTLTEGRMRVVSVVALAGEGRADDGTDAGSDEVLALAGAVEAASEHPIGAAIAREASTRAALAPVTAFDAHGGRGVEGTVGERRVLVGRPEFLASEGAAVDAADAARLADAQSAGRTAVAVGWDGRLRGVIALADTARPTSAAAVARLRTLGLEPILCTGDNAAAAAAVAAEVGITRVVAGVLPEGKVDTVRALQAEGRVVAMVGDGVNDAAALARSDLGLAMGTGTDVAIRTSGITLVSGDLLLAADAVALARRTLSVIRSNLFWAFAYNVAAIPIAALGWLNPAVAGAAMAGSSVFVVTNSLRLRRFTPTHA